MISSKQLAKREQVEKLNKFPPSNGLSRQSVRQISVDGVKFFPISCLADISICISQCVRECGGCEIRSANATALQGGKRLRREVKGKGWTRARRGLENG